MASPHRPTILLLFSLSSIHEPTARPSAYRLASSNPDPIYGGSEIAWAMGLPTVMVVDGRLEKGREQPRHWRRFVTELQRRANSPQQTSATTNSATSKGPCVSGVGREQQKVDKEILELCLSCDGETAGACLARQDPTFSPSQESP